MVSAEELKEELRPAVRDYAEAIQEAAEDQGIDPTHEVVVPTEEGGTELVEVTIPTQGLEDLADTDDISHFEDCAEWLAESEDEVHLARSNTKSSYERKFRGFAKSVFDYVGDYRFDEEAYDAAFTDKIEIHFHDALTLDILVPIPGLKGDSEPVTFSPQSHEYEEEEYLLTVISDFSINEIEPSEMATLQNKSLKGLYGEPTSLGWESRLRYTVDIKNRASDYLEPQTLGEEAGEISEDIVRKVVDGLRISEPQEGNIWYGPIFALRDDWITYREGTEGVEWVIRNPDCDIEHRNPPRFSLDDIGARSFANVFWEEKADLLTSEMFDRPIRRYNRTYLPGHTEDHILDCHIAIEAMLMKGAGGRTSFRMPVGVAVLLKDRASDPVHVYYFFDVLREARNKIVHEDKGVEEINPANLDKLWSFLRKERDAGECIAKFQFVKQAREYLALLIKEYHRIEQEEGLNIHEANQELVSEDEIVEAFFDR